MSGQLQEPAGNSQWALIRQLANEEAAIPFSGSQRIALPQPLRGDEFQSPAASALMRQPAAAQPAMATRNTSLQLMLNGQPLGTLPLGASDSYVNDYQLDIPAAMVVASNNLSFKINDADKLAVRER